MKKSLFITSLMALFSVSALANTKKMDIYSENVNGILGKTPAITIVSNVDELIISKITINRGNCQGWSWEQDVKNRISSYKSNIEGWKKGINNIEGDLSKSKEGIMTEFTMTTDSVKKDMIKDKEKYYSSLRKELTQYLLNTEKSFKTFLETTAKENGKKLGYGNKESFVYSCPSNIVLREVIIEFADGTTETVNVH